MASPLLDFKKFKHIKSDDKSTTLQHTDGHTLVLAHNVLSPDNQKALRAMAGNTPEKPNYGKIIQKADGGEIKLKGNPELHKKGMEILKAKGEAHKPSAKTDKFWQTAKEQLKTTGHKGPYHEEFSDGGGVGAPGSYAPTTNTPPKDDVKNQMDTAPSTASGWMDRIVEGVTSDKDHAKGGIIKKMAHGGRMSIGDDYNHSGPGSESMSTYDAGLPCLNPNCKSHGKPHPNCRCYSGGEQFHEGGNMAEGGAVKRMRFCAHGKPHMEGCEYARGGTVHSEQGRDVRYANKIKESDPEMHELSKDFAKHEAKGRAEMERTIKPKMKGLAEGGPVRKMYADDNDGVVSQDDQAPPYLRQPSPSEDKSSLDKLIDMKHAESMPSAPEEDHRTAFEKDIPKIKQAWANRPIPGVDRSAPQEQVAQAQPTQNIPPVDPNFNSVTGQTVQPQSQPAIDENANTPAVDEPQGQLDRSDNYGHMAADNSQPTDSNAPSDIPQRQLPLSQQIQQEDAAWAQDLANQHITPQTYASLYESKGTLGKIGQIFGLMLGGIGGVKTGTNSAMQMMDKIISNDLEAQKASKTNAHNFLNQTYQHELQQAQARGLDASSENVQQEAKLKAYTLGRMYATRSAYQDIVNKIKTMPEGANKDAAIQAATALGSQLDTSHKNLADQAQALQMALSSGGGTAGPGFQKAAALSGDPNMKAVAAQSSARTIPGVPGEAQRDIPSETRTELLNQNKFDTVAKNLHGLIEKSRGKLSSLSPVERNAAAQQAMILQSLFRSGTLGTVYKVGEQPLLDKAVDGQPLDILKYFTELPKLEGLMKSNQEMKGETLKSYGFPVAPSKEIRVDKQGNRWQQGPNGFPIRVK